MSIWLILIALSGCYSIFMALVTKTNDLISSVIFKAVPFFFGGTCLLYALKEFGII